MTEKPKHLLNQWFASAISGNDITGSVLYMGGLCTALAGPYAPISILLVVMLLYLFRSVYAEVVTALPLNGGAYNALLNTTLKVIAAVGGTLTVLSYVATAVVSADSAVVYFSSLVPSAPSFWLPIAVLGTFALLNLIGISESSVVALIVFVIHLTTLSILLVVALVFLFQNNWYQMVPNWSEAVRNQFGNPFQAIAYGFGAAMLGVSGFESSSNYVEEQAPGVFPKTLRNMWIAVAFFNPLLTLCAIGMIPVEVIREHTLPACAAAGSNVTFILNGANYTDVSPCDPMLSQMAALAGGSWLHILVGVDASLVLCGGVLTSYVGVVGLMKRMSLDRCLPAFFLHQNPITKTNHFIILSFFLTTSSLYLIVAGDIQTLAGVYSMAFLCVMALFAMANMLLKYKRGKLPRDIQSTWPGVLTAFFGVIAGLIINMIVDVSIIEYFAIYFSIFLALSMVMFVRLKLLRIILNLFRTKRICRGRCGRTMKKWVQELNNQSVVFFTKDGLLSVLNKAITYIRDNEFTDNVIIVHFCKEGEGDIDGHSEKDEILRAKLHRMRTNVRILDRMYPKSRISFLLVEGEFGKEGVEHLSEHLEIPRNFFFMATPTAGLDVNYADLGGVRLITH